MKTSKKILGVVLALVMLVNVFAMFSFAAAPDSAIDLTITADKASYSAGDVVTFTVHEKVESAVGDMRIGGRYAIGYNKAGIEPLSDDGMDITKHNVTCFVDGSDLPNSTVSFTEDNTSMGDAIDEGHGWDSVVVYGVNDDGLTGFDATAGVDLFSFQMKIPETAPDGDYVVGFNVGSYINYNAYSNDQAMGCVAGYDDDYGYGTTANYGFTNVTIHVGSAAAAPVLTHEGRQVKMTVEDNKVVPGTEQLRVVSSISNDDWNAYFANTTDKAATTDKIVAVGFVAYKGQASTFNADTAKAVAQGTATDSNYTVATTDYIQNTGSGYRFGARVEYKTAVYDTTYLAFVQYKDASSNDAYVFYDTSTIYSLDFASNYGKITSDYIDFLNS